MAGKKIGVVIALDGEKEFSQKVQSANKEANSLKAQMKLLAAEYDGNANSLAFLTKKQEILTKQQEAYQKKVDSSKSGLQKAIENYDKQSKKLDELEDSLGKASKALEDMKNAGKEGTDAYKKQEKSVEDLKEAVERQTIAKEKEKGAMSDWNKKIFESEAALTKTNKEIDKNAEYLKEAESSADKCAKSINNYGDEVKEATEVTTSFGEKIGSALVNKGVSVAVDALGTLKDKAFEAAEYVVDVGSSFEAAMSEVSAISGATGDQLSAMEEKAKELGSTTKFSATEAAEAFKYMSLAGWSTSDMLSGIDGVMNLAAASGMDLATASDMVTDYLSAFGMQAADSAYMADLLAYAQSHSNTTAEQLGEAYKNSAANMHAAGQDIETTTSLLEAMANQGLKGSEAGTALSAMMRDITAKMEDGKIAIGDTSVAVMDANGNYRDLTDILTDVESATDGMGSAEKNAALQSTFTADSIKGLNLVLADGMENVAGYETALRNSDGAAQEMADTMQNNLKGKLTEMGSALEGLGIAAYQYVDGPLSGVVEGVTGIIQGITEKLSPAKDGVEELKDNIIGANDELNAALESRNSVVAGAETEAASLESLGKRLVYLNGLEETSTGQKAEMKQIVDQLSESIPELAAAYDSETGSLKMSSDEIMNYVDAQKEAIITQATLAANQDLINSLVEAQIKYDEAAEKAKEMKDQIAIYEAQLEEIDKLDQKMAEGKITSDQYNEGLMEIAMQYEDMLQSGDISLSTLQADLQKLLASEQSGYADTQEELEDLNGTIEDGTGEINKRRESAEKLTEAMKGAGKTVSDGSAAFKEYKSSTDDAVPSIEEAADSLFHVGEALNKVPDAAGEASEAIDTNTDSMSENAQSAEEAAKAISDAYDNAFQTIVEAYESTKEEMKNGLSVDFLSDEFDGGVDLTVEKMLKNSETQLEGLRNYEKNLAEVRDHIGKEISPAFLEYLEGMGTDGANILNHICKTFEQDNGSEIVKEWSDNYVESLEIQDDLATTLANDKLFLENGLAELGSTDLEWTGLQESFEAAQKVAEDGGTKVTQSAIDSFNEAYGAAQAAGITIPEGLADGLASGEISVQSAADQLNAALEGQFDGLAEIARRQGVEIPPELASGIEEGGQAAADAYSALISLLGQYETDAQAAGSEAGDSQASGYKESLENATGEVSAAGGDMAQAGADAAADKANEFQKAGEESAGQYTKALIAARSQAVQAANDMASSARAALASYQNSFYNTGYYMSAGIADGIRAGKSSVVNAAIEVAKAALAATKKELGIASPSRKFRNEVGKHIGSGFALGIKDSTALAGKAADRMSNVVYSNATTWLSSYKSKQKTSLADEKYYWEQISKHVKKGSEAYENAQKKINKINNSMIGESAQKKISNNFGVSKTTTTTTGSGKNKKTVTKNKSDADYYGEIYSAAEQYLENYQTLHNMSLDKEEAYWEQVQKKLKKGTQGWYNAQKKLNAIRDEQSEKESEYYQKQIDKVDSANEKLDLKAEQNVNKSVDYAKKQLENWEKQLAKLDKKKNPKEYAEVQKNIVSAYDDIVSAAEQYVENKKTIGKMTAKQELEYWQDIQKNLDKGTQAWYDAQEKINDAKERITEESNNKYDKMVSDAEEYVRKQKILGKMTTKQELEYWQDIIKGIKKGTNAWYDAKEKISSLKEKIKNDTASVQNNILSGYKTYYKVSAKAEAQYWNIARKKIKKGTDERIAADQNYLSALQAWYDERKELDEDYAENSKEINDKLKDDVQELEDAYKDAVSSRKQDILSSMNLFEAWDSEGYDGDTLLYNLKTQVAGLTLWEQQLEELGKKGLSSELMDELKAMGPDAAASIYSLNQMTAEQLDEYDKLWQQKNALAESQAVKDNEQLRLDSNEQIKQLRLDAQSELNALNADYRAALKELNTGISDDLANLAKQSATIGEDAVSGLIAGLEKASDSVDTYKSTTKVVKKVSSQLKSLQQEGTVIGKSTLDGLLEGMQDENKINLASKNVIQSIKKAIEEEAEIHSPSRLFRRETGPQIPAGVALGMEDGTDLAVQSAQGMMQKTLEAAQEEMQKQQASMLSYEGTLDFSGIAKLNRLTETAGQASAPVVNINNDTLASLLGTLISAVNGVSSKMDNQQVVMDTGALVAAIQPAVSQESAAVSVRKRRGRL